DDDIAALDDVFHRGRRPRLLPRVETGGAADLALDPGALGRLGDVAGRRRPARVDAQAATVEIFGRLAVELHCLGAAVGDADKLQQPGAIRVPVLAEPGHLVPEPGHCRLAVLVAEIRQVGVDVVHLRTPLPGLDRAAAGNPHRRVRLLNGARPDVD